MSLDLSRFVGLEIAPVVVVYEDERRTVCERTDDPDEADFWSVYGRIPAGDVEWWQDFATEQQARDFAAHLMERI